jgi:hypothetical protein
MHRQSSQPGCQVSSPISISRALDVAADSDALRERPVMSSTPVDDIVFGVLGRQGRSHLTPGARCCPNVARHVYDD